MTESKPSARHNIVTIASMCLLVLMGGCSDRSGGKVPSYKQNPAPIEQYNLTVAVENAPGPFDLVEGLMQYRITNPECLPPAESFSGVQMTSQFYGIPIEFSRLQDGTYAAVVAADGLEDADYFGRGICHWEPMGPLVQMRAADNKVDARFIISLSSVKLASGEPERKHYKRDNYPRIKIADYPDTGKSDPGEFDEEIRGKVFSITLKSKELTK
ncbi:hypothetical protein [Lysobacter antibioticus]|nr:hypothetical protein [Lysobacter antibioticus]